MSNGVAKDSRIRAELAVADKDYALLTLHRPSSVDNCESFTRILDALEQISVRLPIVFPIHPRARKMLLEYGLSGRIEKLGGVRIIEPLGYLDFLSLMSGARVVLTDSGGIQEETTVLGIPCVTLRENTERPITVEMGTNTIVGSDPAKIVAATFSALEKQLEKDQHSIPPLWDGHTAERIVDALITRSG